MLEREGGVLRGSLTSLPGDCLALAVRALMGPELQQKLRYTIWQYVVLYSLAVMGGGILCCLAGRLIGRFLVQKMPPGTRMESRTALWIVPFALLLTAGWEAAILGTWVVARQSIYEVFAGQESPYFHEHFFVPSACNVGFMLFVLPAGFLLVRNGARRSFHLTE